MASQFDEAAGELNILKGPDNPKPEEDSSDSGEESDTENEDTSDEEENNTVVASSIKHFASDAEAHSKSLEIVGDGFGEGLSSISGMDNSRQKSEDRQSSVTGNDNVNNVDSDGLAGEDSNVKTDNKEVTSDSAELIQSTNDKDLKENASGEISDDESESNDELDEIGELNRGLRPFRNEESLTHVNKHIQKGRQRSSDSMMSTCTSTSSIDPSVIREKVKRQQKRKDEKLKARRIRKSGEASIVTKSRRDKQLDIKQSLGPDWY